MNFYVQIIGYIFAIAETLIVSLHIIHHQILIGNLVKFLVKLFS